jgi:hypothetical protein
MCQCVILDCWWWNCCGAFCAGLHDALFLISCWLMKPPEMSNQQCCVVGEWTGYGGNCFCYGSLCCAPDFVKSYSSSLKWVAANSWFKSDFISKLFYSLFWVIKYSLLLFSYTTINCYCSDRSVMLNNSLNFGDFIYFTNTLIIDKNFSHVLWNDGKTWKQTAKPFQLPNDILLHKQNTFIIHSKDSIF